MEQKQGAPSGALEGGRGGLLVLPGPCGQALLRPHFSGLVLWHPSPTPLLWDQRRNLPMVSLPNALISALSRAQDPVVMCMGWHSTNRRPILYSQKYHKPPSVGRGGTPLHCMRPMRAKEGVEWSQSRLQDSIFFPSPSLLTHTHTLSLSLSLTHTHTRTCHHVYFISND